jgi:hypothetical protein
MEIELGEKIVLYTLMGFLVIFLGSIALTLLLNKKEIKKDRKKRTEAEIKEAVPYSNIEQAKKQVVSENLRLMLWYGVYYVISIPTIVLFLGEIKYGPNLPYTIFLIVTGIPFLICFMQVILKVEKQRLRLLASGVPSKSLSFYLVNWIVLIPLIFVVILIPLLLKISKKLF